MVSLTELLTIKCRQKLNILSEYDLSLEGVILESLCAWGDVHITKVYGNKFSVLEDSILNITLES